MVNKHSNMENNTVNNRSTGTRLSNYLNACRRCVYFRNRASGSTFEPVYIMMKKNTPLKYNLKKQIQQINNFAPAMPKLFNVTAIKRTAVVTVIVAGCPAS